MAGSIHLDDIGTRTLDTATQRLGTSSSAEHEATFEHQAFHGEPAADGSRSMPGSFPSETPPPSPTSGMHTAIENLDDPIHEEPHAPATLHEADEGPHTPSASDVGHGTQSFSGDSAHAPATADADDRFEQASQAEQGHAGQAVEAATSRPGPLTRWSERNYKFGDMLDKSLKPYMVPLTAAGLTAGVGLGIYNATKK